MPQPTLGRPLGPSGTPSGSADRRRDSHRHGAASAPWRPRDADGERSQPAPRFSDAGVREWAVDPASRRDPTTSGGM